MYTKEQQENLDEQLSALVDGELNREEQAFVLRRIGHARQARDRLARYFLIRDALQRNLPAYPNPALAQRVHEMLLDEPDSNSNHAALNWRRPALGGAIAASVALLSVLWWQGNMHHAGGSANEQQVRPTVQQRVDLPAERQTGDYVRSVREPRPQPGNNQTVGKDGGTMPAGSGVGFGGPWQRVASDKWDTLEQRPAQPAEQDGWRANYSYPGVSEIVPGSGGSLEPSESVQGQRAAAP